jgi:hypothetical protein
MTLDQAASKRRLPESTFMSVWFLSIPQSDDSWLRAARTPPATTSARVARSHKDITKAAGRDAKQASRTSPRQRLWHADPPTAARQTGQGRSSG